MVSYKVLGAFLVAASALAISPGPDNIFVLTQSITNGTKRGLAVVFGLVSGCLVHTTLLAVGVSAMLKQNDTVFWAIKIFGVAYLVYLAYQVFRSDGGIDLNTSKSEKGSVSKSFVKGFTMNVLNPKVTIFFLAFFPGFLFSETLSHFTQFFVLGGLFMLDALIIFGAIAILAGNISHILTQSPKAGLYLKWLQIIVFLGIAIYLLIS